jgi:hypothetical protein
MSGAPDVISLPGYSCRGQDAALIAHRDPFWADASPVDAAVDALETLGYSQLQPRQLTFKRPGSAIAVDSHQQNNKQSAINVQ